MQQHRLAAAPPFQPLLLVPFFLACFVAIALAVPGTDPVTRWDLRVVGWLAQHRDVVLTQFMTAISWLHGTVQLSLATAVLALWLVRKRAWHWLVTLVLAVPGGMLMNLLVKLLFQRHRPLGSALIVPDTFYSFPSGHTAGATLFYGMLCALAPLMGVPPQRRPLLVAIACSCILLVALSRVYLGVHFPSDVLGAFAEAAAWLALCLGFQHAARARGPGPQPASGWR